MGEIRFHKTPFIYRRFQKYHWLDNGTDQQTLLPMACLQEIFVNQIEDGECKVSVFFNGSSDVNWGEKRSKLLISRKLKKNITVV